MGWWWGGGVLWSTTGNCQWPVGAWPRGPQCRNWQDSSLLLLLRQALLSLLSTDPRTQRTQAHLYQFRGQTGREASSRERSSSCLAHRPLHPWSLVPGVWTAREPVSPSAQCLLSTGGSRSTPDEVRPGKSRTRCGDASGYCERLQTLHPQPAGPLLRLPPTTPALQLTGPAGERRRPRCAGSALGPRGSLLRAQTSGRSLPWPFRSRRALRDSSPSQVPIREILKLSPPFSRRASQRHFTGFSCPSQVGWGGELGPGSKRRPEPPPPPLATSRHSRVQRPGLRGSPASGRAATLAAPPSSR